MPPVAQEAVIGVLLDVSASMLLSMRNPQAPSFTTPHAVLKLIEDSQISCERSLRAQKHDNAIGDCRSFVYACGLRLPEPYDVLDLGTAAAAAEHLSDLGSANFKLEQFADTTASLVDRLQRRFELRLAWNEIETAKGLMGSEAQALLRMTRDVASHEVRNRAVEYIRLAVKESVRQQVIRTTAEVCGLDRFGTGTVGIQSSWSNLLRASGRLSKLSGGPTALATALNLIAERFEHERQNSPAASNCILLIISDGRSTDEDPRLQARRLRDAGVTIISCLVASEDWLRPDIGVNNCERNWPDPVAVMFDLASWADRDSGVGAFLAGFGYKIESSRLKLCFQLNHSLALSRIDSALIAAQQEFPSAREESVPPGQVAPAPPNVVTPPFIRRVFDWRRRKRAGQAPGESAEMIRDAAISGLTDPDHEKRMECADKLADMADDLSIEPLVEALSDPIPYVRLRAARALGRMHHERVIRPLLRALRDPEYSVCGHACDALTAIPFEEAVDGLIAELTTTAASEAARALGRIGDPKAVEPLLGLLQESTSSDGRRVAEERAAAVIALGAIGDKRAVNKLIEVLDHDPEDYVTRFAAEALGKLRDEKALPALVRATRKHSGFTSKYATAALQQFGSAAVEPLLRLAEQLSMTSIYTEPGRYEGMVRARVAEALAHLEDARIIPMLVRLVLVDRSDVMDNAPAARELLLGQNAVEALIRELNSDNWRVREASMQFLSESRDLRATDPLIEMLKSAQSSDRATAASALGKIGDARAVQPLRLAAEDIVKEVRERATDALRHLKALS